MSLVRSILLAAALATLAGAARADEVSMAGGRVGFDVPAGWSDILDAQGATEMRVFQVPGTPDGTLARVSVMIRHVDGFGAFEQFRSAAEVKARGLPGYQPVPGADATDTLAYTAREGATNYTYQERYVFRGALAIQLRCARPSRATDKGWTAAFERDCARIGAELAQ